jgi:hypothetical protein
MWNITITVEPTELKEKVEEILITEKNYSPAQIKEFWEQPDILDKLVDVANTTMQKEIDYFFDKASDEIMESAESDLLACLQIKKPQRKSLAELCEKYGMPYHPLKEVI